MLAVVTGATKGIGKAIAERFAAAGFNLVLTARSATDLTLLKQELEKTYKIKVYPRPSNFQKKADVVLFGEFAKESSGGKIDVLVNNVGQYLTGHLFELPGDKLLEQLQVNLMAAHYLTSSLGEGFRNQRSGHIFTIGSIVSRKLREEAAFYSISKQALYAWHQLLVEEMRNYNVKATIIQPSSTYTASWEGSGVKQEELIQPETIAACIYDTYNLSGPVIPDELSIRTMLKKYE